MMKKKLSDLDKAKKVLPQFIWPHDPGTPLSLAEASKHLYTADPNQYYRLLNFLGPLLDDEEEEIRRPLEITGAAPEIIRQHLEEHKRQQSRVAKIVLRRIPDTLPTFDDALIQLDKDDPEPFFRLVPLFGPMLFNKKEVRLAIQRWFSWKSSGHPADRKLGQSYLKRLGTQLAYVKKGQVSKEPEASRQSARRGKTRARKREFDDTINKKKEELQKEIDKCIDKLPRVLSRSPSYRQITDKIRADILTKARDDSKATTRNAAKELMDKLEREQF
jgi:hypothetical protein